MSGFGVFWAGVKGFFSWNKSIKESIIDYVLEQFNRFLTQDNVADKVKEGYEMSERVLGYMAKYMSWCPAAWMGEYAATMFAVDSINNMLSDGTVTRQELEVVVTEFKNAYAGWKED